MQTAQSDCPAPDRQHLSAVLSDDRTRHLLGCLQSGPSSPAALATALAATERECAPAAVPPAVEQRYRARIHHDYLPRLEAAGLIARTGDGRIRLEPVRTDHFDVSLPDFDEPAEPSWTAAAAVLARPYRHRLLSLLADAGGPVSVSSLAADLARAEPALADIPRPLSVTLHHVDLPKLAAVELVTYDADDKTATATPAAQSLL